MERFECTKETPWSPDRGRAFHPDAKSVGDTYDWSAYHHDYETYVCPNCNLRFEVDLPN